MKRKSRSNKLKPRSRNKKLTSLLPRSRLKKKRWKLKTKRHRLSNQNAQLSRKMWRKRKPILKKSFRLLAPWLLRQKKP